MKTLRMPMTLILLLFVTACVTINVYFPAEAAERAADRIIRDVYGEEPAAEEAPAAEPQTQNPGRVTPVAVLLLDWFITPAHAEVDISVDSQAIRQLKASMAERHQQLAPHYDSGAVGMTNDGQITVRDQKLVPLKNRNAVKGVVSKENRDRSALYAEIARANGHPEWEGEIRKTFARRWVANAHAGWWYRNDKGAWGQK